jgi:16S rRNA (uracil1498-N3)-methyltransferase
MSDRYFVEEPISTDRVALTGAEAHHLIHVMRAVPGINVMLFDGGGDEFSAVVEQVGRSEVQLAIHSRNCVDRELPFRLTLGIALPKGDRQRWLVEKATELGIARIIPLRTRRGVAQPVEQALYRLRRTVVEASKQCGRNRLLQIDEPQSWPDFVATTIGEPCRLLAHPGAAKNQRTDQNNSPLLLGEGQGVRADYQGDNPIFTVQKSGQSPFVLAAIGPEGGFTDDEVASALEAGWRTIDLGPRILRVETAAIFLAARIISDL